MFSNKHRDCNTTTCCLHVHVVHGGPRPPEATPAAVVVVLEGVDSRLSALDHAPKLPESSGRQGATDGAAWGVRTQPVSAVTNRQACLGSVRSDGGVLTNQQQKRKSRQLHDCRKNRTRSNASYRLQPGGGASTTESHSTRTVAVLLTQLSNQNFKIQMKEMMTIWSDNQ